MQVLKLRDNAVGAGLTLVVEPVIVVYLSHDAIDAVRWKRR